MPEITPRARACLLAALCAGCVDTPPAPRLADASRGTLALEAHDARGEPAELELLPRRPTLVLSHPDGIAADPGAIALFAGEPDLELRADLERTPLTTAQLVRRIDCQLQASGSELRIAPNATLAPDAAYTLAVAAWARSPRGRALLGEGSITFVLRTSADLDAGARVLHSWPADGASGLGTNLLSAVVAFDGFVDGADHAIWIEGYDRLAVPSAVESGPCSEVAPEHAAPFCVRLAPEHRLAPAALHRLVIGIDARDGHGAPVGPWQASFRTAEGRDAQPPVALVSSCAIDEQATEVGCALADDASIALRLQANEPVTATLHAGAQVLRGVAANGALALRVTGLSADALLPAELELRDSAGNTARHDLELQTTPALATLAISEVLADPLGSEPQQEFVEIVNFGSVAIDLDGLVLSDRADDPGAALASTVRILPQARVLLVADAYDPRNPSDPRPPPGAQLVRVGKAIGSAGLRNAGEALFLRDALGRRLSAAPATPRPRPGVCLVRASQHMRSGAPEDFAYDADETCTPGE